MPGQKGILFYRKRLLKKTAEMFIMGANREPVSTTLIYDDEKKERIP